jgi:uncharacterized damage-inducible protein DinB
MTNDYDRDRFSLLARYNREANEKLFAILAALPAGEFSAARGSYFDSIGGILSHVISGDINWMRRFRELFGDSGTLAHTRLQPAGHGWINFQFDTLEELARERVVVDGLLIEFVASADTSRFGEVLAYSDSSGTPRRYIFRDALAHLFNHQTHHRGQVSQILDALGVENDYSNIYDVLETP